MAFCSEFKCSACDKRWRQSVLLEARFQGRWHLGRCQSFKFLFGEGTEREGHSARPNVGANRDATVGRLGPDRENVPRTPGRAKTELRGTCAAQSMTS